MLLVIMIEANPCSEILSTLLITEFAQDFESTSPVVVAQQHQRQHGCDSDGVRDGLRRRVRIALKSAPAPGGEGGEWEVEFR